MSNAVQSDLRTSNSTKAVKKEIKRMERRKTRKPSKKKHWNYDAGWAFFGVKLWFISKQLHSTQSDGFIKREKREIKKKNKRETTCWRRRNPRGSHRNQQRSEENKKGRKEKERIIDVRKCQVTVARPAHHHRHDRHLIYFYFGHGLLFFWPFFWKFFFIWAKFSVRFFSFSHGRPPLSALRMRFSSVTEFFFLNSFF